MALEEILQTRGKLNLTQEIIDGAAKADPNVLSVLGALAHGEDERFPVQFYQDKNPFDVTQGASTLGRSYQNELADKVSRNYDEVLRNLDERRLISLALSVKPHGDSKTAKKHRKYLEEAKKLQEGLQKGDSRPYMEGITHQGVREIMEYHARINPQRIFQAWKQHVGYLENEVISEFVKMEGKKPKLVRENLTAYLIRNTSNLNDKEKKGVYVNAALNLPAPKQEGREAGEEGES